MASDTYAGPIDYLVFALPVGAPVAPGLQAVLDRVNEGIIELLDVEVVGRDDNGEPVLLPLSGLPASPEVDLAEFDGVSSGILDADDLAAIAASLDTDQLAVAVVYEDRSLLVAARAWGTVGGVELFSGGVDIAELERHLDEGDSHESV